MDSGPFARAPAIVAAFVLLAGLGADVGRAADAQSPFDSGSQGYSCDRRSTDPHPLCVCKGGKTSPDCQDMVDHTCNGGELVCCNAQGCFCYPGSAPSSGGCPQGYDPAMASRGPRSGVGIVEGPGMERSPDIPGLVVNRSSAIAPSGYEFRVGRDGTASLVPEGSRHRRAAAGAPMVTGKFRCQCECASDECSGCSIKTSGDTLKCGRCSSDSNLSCVLQTVIQDPGASGPEALSDPDRAPSSTQELECGPGEVMKLVRRTDRRGGRDERSYVERCVPEDRGDERRRGDRRDRDERRSRDMRRDYRDPQCGPGEVSQTVRVRDRRGGDSTVREVQRCVPADGGTRREPRDREDRKRRDYRDRP